MAGKRSLLLWLLAACLVSPLAFAEERILEYRSDIQVHADGRLTVTETIRVRAEGNAIRRGIYRDFPTDYRDRLGNRVRVDFQPLSVLRNGHPEPWHSERRSNGVRVYAGSRGRMLEPGVHEYRLTFGTNRQLGYFDTHDELYFNAVGTGWAFPIDRAVATVSLPFSVSRDRLGLYVYAGAAGSTASRAQAEAATDGTVRFMTTGPLEPGEGMTIAVTWPKGLVPEPDMEQRLQWFFADNGAALVLLLGVLAPLGWYLWAWNRVGRDPRKGVIIPRFEPPTGLSPAACRYVKDMSFDRHAFTAAIVSLAVKGQLTIEEHGEDFSLLRSEAPPRVELSPGERAVLEALLPSPGERIEMDNENHKIFGEARSELKKALKKEYRGRLFLLNRIYLLPPMLMSVVAVGLAAFFTGGPAVWIVFALLTIGLHALFVFLLRAPTPSGRVVMDEIEGFRSYLDTAEQDRLERMQSPRLTPEVFEAFLPYAYALGVENSWCERFAREVPAEQPDQRAYHPSWYRGQFHGIAAVGHLGDSFSASFSSAIASASTPPGSAGGGGGSVGGGGGGGGGGGW